MNDRVPARLSEISRGETNDELWLVDTAGAVVILHAHGIGLDEQRRTREAALTLLLEALAR